MISVAAVTAIALTVASCTSAQAPDSDTPGTRKGESAATTTTSEDPYLTAFTVRMLLAGYEQPNGDAAATMDAAADVVALLALTLAPARSVADPESVGVVTAAVNRARSAMYPERMQSQGGLAARASTVANFAAEEGVASADEIRAWVDALYAADRAIAHDAGTALGIAIIRGDALAVANAADSLRLHADTITDLFALAVSATERARDDTMNAPSEDG